MRLVALYCISDMPVSFYLYPAVENMVSVAGSYRQVRNILARLVSFLLKCAVLLDTIRILLRLLLSLIALDLFAVSLQILHHQIFSRQLQPKPLGNNVKVSKNISKAQLKEGGHWSHCPPKISSVTV